MLSVASVRSASGAAEYFAKDDYYTAEHSSEATAWAGEGAAALGLAGEVDKAAFEGILNGMLPSGEAVGQVANRRTGLDLTFSMPKSASVMAYVAGDTRLLDANLRAVRATMAWAEKQLAEGRRDVDGRKVPVRTGNLVYALFQHDTSRALDPQAHVHAVVANLTRMPDGKWQALHNGRLWSENTTLGSIYHAELRAEVERLGYQVVMTGKHGAFELAGVPKAVREAFSQRREAILAKADELNLHSPKALNSIAVRTRDDKIVVEDRAALREDWRERAGALGFRGDELRRLAEVRSAVAQARSPLQRGYQVLKTVVETTRTSVAALLRPDDPLVETSLERRRLSAPEVRAQFATASAIRILGEREAAFATSAVVKTALDLGLPQVTGALIGARMAELTCNGQLVPEHCRRLDGTTDLVTTPEALATEERILASVAAGQGRAAPIVAPGEVAERLSSVADQALNAGQLAAASMILGSRDRTVLVQGVAGAGKSTMLGAVASVAEAEGLSVLGLAFQNKMVADLAEGAGIEARTLASFLAEQEREHSAGSSPGLSRTMLLVDETSMVSSADMLRLLDVSERVGVARLVLVGDRRQLASIEAGKAFALIQAGGGATARMDENLRQRTDVLRTVAALANRGRAGQALQLLGSDVHEARDPAADAADRWLAVPPDERERTLVLASGRVSRDAINARVQAGLVQEGALTGPGMSLEVQTRVSLTREELRLPSNYRPGQILEVRAREPTIGLERGRYQVMRVTPAGKVEVKGLRTHRFDPQRLPIGERQGRVELLETRDLTLHPGDRIRWTANDRARGLANSALAKVLAIEPAGIRFETDAGDPLTLKPGDPMLRRIDLAYSLNMHMAQGITADRAIMVLSSSERHLTNQRLFNVGVSRVRDALTLVVDSKEAVERQLAHNSGDKHSALETVGKVDVDRAPRRTALADPQTPTRDPLGDLGLDWSSIHDGADRGLGQQPRAAQTRDDGLAAKLELPERSLGLEL